MSRRKPYSVSDEDRQWILDRFNKALSACTHEPTKVDRVLAAYDTAIAFSEKRHGVDAADNGFHTSSNIVGSIVGMSPTTINEYRKLAKSDRMDIISKYESGELTLSRAIQIISGVSEKRCSVCGKIKPIADFSTRTSVCKVCRSTIGSARVRVKDQTKDRISMIQQGTAEDPLLRNIIERVNSSTGKRVKDPYHQFHMALGALEYHVTQDLKAMRECIPDNDSEQLATSRKLYDIIEKIKEFERLLK